MNGIRELDMHCESSAMLFCQEIVVRGKLIPDIRPGDEFPRHLQVKIALWMTRTQPRDGEDVDAELGSGRQRSTIGALVENSTVDTE